MALANVQALHVGRCPPMRATTTEVTSTEAALPVEVPAEGAKPGKPGARWVEAALAAAEGQALPEVLLAGRAASRAALARFAESGVANRIGGEDSRPGATFESRSPVDGRLLAQVARGDAAEADRAAQAAKDAFPVWRDMPGAERKALLHRIADAIVARAEDIAAVECMDTGQCIRFMSKAALRGAKNFRFFADRAPAARDGQALPSPTLLNVTTRVPIGPVGVITPWNTPFMLSTWKIAPALAAGCTVVHKPAEFSPLTARMLVEIAEEAGLPPGVWNLVNGMGEDAGRALTEHPAIRAIGFVGDTKTGRAIMRQGAETLKRVHFELGGKNPCLVFADADLDRALDAAVFMIFSLNGERCTSSSRLLVEASIHDAFVARLTERVNALKVGHPLDPATEVGPLIHPVHVDKVAGYFDAARAEGASIAAGGARIEGEGCYVAPTLFTDVSADMRVAQEEIFGPVLTVIPFADEAEALQIANGTDYGLTAYVWTRDLTRAMRVTDRLEAGMIWVNSENVRHLPTPFGGVKASGSGRDGGDWSFDFYMETKHVGFATGEHATPRRGAGYARRAGPGGPPAHPPRPAEAGASQGGSACLTPSAPCAPTPRRKACCPTPPIRRPSTWCACRTSPCASRTSPAPAPST